jgi:hypothetical protein
MYPCTSLPTFGAAVCRESSSNSHRIRPHLHHTFLPHLPEALHGAVKVPELGESIGHGVPHDDARVGQFVEHEVRVVGEAEPEVHVDAEHGAGAEEVVREAATE